MRSVHRGLLAHCFFPLHATFPGHYRIIIFDALHVGAICKCLSTNLPDA